MSKMRDALDHWLRTEREQRQQPAVVTEDEGWTDVGEDFVPNRRQRRQYIRVWQPKRDVRIHLVGFGLWRRHGGGRQRENWAVPGDEASASRREARGRARLR